MATPQNANDLIRLPRLTIEGLVTLATQLENRAANVISELSAQHRELPRLFLKAVTSLSKAKTSLESVLIAQGISQRAYSISRQADQSVDTIWRAIDLFLRGWSLLEDEQSPGAKEAAHAHHLLIGDDMKFITLPFELEWQETKKRIGILEEQKLEETFKNLGGERFIAQLRKAFTHYGVALKITAEPAPSEIPPLVRPALEELQKSLRLYISKVINLEDPDDPESQTLISRLLQPLHEWESRPKPKNNDATPTLTPSPNEDSGV